MYLNNAHLHVIREARDLLKHDIEDVHSLLESARYQPLRHFRMAIARHVLECMSWKVGRLLVPAGELQEELFCDHVAIALACTAENDRPSCFHKYSVGRFAKVLIERYMLGYTVIDDLGFPDEEVPKFTLIMEDIPTDPHDELRDFVRQIDISTFGHYTLPNEVHLFNEPESL